MSAIGKPNLRRWAGVGWGTKKAKKLFVKEGLKLAAKMGYGRLFRISKGRGREFQMMGTATEKLRDPKPVRARGRVINWSQKSVKYEMGHNVSVMSGGNQASASFSGKSKIDSEIFPSFQFLMPVFSATSGLHISDFSIDR